MKDKYTKNIISCYGNNYFLNNACTLTIIMKNHGNTINNVAKCS